MTNNQRAYNRSSHFSSQAKVSRDGSRWKLVEVSDVSSGGLKFRDADEYAQGDLLWFDLTLEGFLSEIRVKTQGEIRRVTAYEGIFQYGVAFRGLSPEKKIQIDENIRNDRPISGAGYEMD